MYRKRETLWCLWPCLVVLTACATVKDGKVTITKIPADCTSVSIRVTITEGNDRRAETIGGPLNGSTTYGPKQLSPKYLDRTYGANEITIVVECGEERRTFRNPTPIAIPAKGEVSLDISSFEEQ